jgi:hypothetical protein
MRCPNEQAAICKECDGYGTNECDHCGREGECNACDGTGRSNEHTTACEWCEAGSGLGKEREFFLREDIAEIVRADAMDRIPDEAQRFIVELAECDAIAIAPAVVHEDLVVFAVRRGREPRIAPMCGEGKLFLPFKPNTPESVGVWFAISIPAFKAKDIKQDADEAIARRLTHAAA